MFKQLLAPAYSKNRFPLLQSHPGIGEVRSVPETVHRAELRNPLFAEECRVVVFPSGEHDPIDPAHQHPDESRVFCAGEQDRDATSRCDGVVVVTADAAVPAVAGARNPDKRLSGMGGKHHQEQCGCKADNFCQSVHIIEYVVRKPG